jgi:hypothetical protein
MKRIDEINAKYSAIDTILDSPYINDDVKVLITYYDSLEVYKNDEDFFEERINFVKDNAIQRLKRMIQKLEQ